MLTKTSYLCRTTIAVATCVLLVSCLPAYGSVVEFNSGNYEPIDYSIYATIAIDNTASPSPGTHVEILDGGKVNGAVYTYNNAKFTLNEGEVFGTFQIHDNSLISIKKGKIVGVSSNLFFVFEDSLVELFGNNFTVDGMPVTSGDSLRDYSTYNGTFYTGDLQGTLLDGTSLGGKFYIYNNADIVVTLVPEPTTLSLLMLGSVALAGLCLRCRRRV